MCCFGRLLFHWGPETLVFKNVAKACPGSKLRKR